jgi:hypothetical protein
VPKYVDFGNLETRFVEHNMLDYEVVNVSTSGIKSYQIEDWPQTNHLNFPSTLYILVLLFMLECPYESPSLVLVINDTKLLMLLYQVE